jgi:ubiquinone/menaquinone biosynthesis C-methylase UbiE
LQPGTSLAPTDYGRIASRYDLARDGPRGRLTAWRTALSPFLEGAGLPILDVGSGTGYWAEALADWFALNVVAVEPSRAMRQEALQKRRHAAVSYLGGRAEKLPLREGSCESAWLSTVVHHISDLDDCAHELQCVGSGGRVLIRNVFSGRADGIPWLHYFEHVRHQAEARWPTVDEVLAAFEPAGFVLECLQPVEEVTDLSLASYARRVGVRADSTLASISDEDFNLGMSELERAVAAEREPKPVVTKLDLLVLKIK